MKTLMAGAALAAAAFASLVAACGDVDVNGTTSSSSSSGAGGTGGGCSVALPVGCGCPDDPAGSWTQAFSVAGADEATQPSALGGLPIAPDGSTVLRVETNQLSGNTGMLASARLVKLDATGHIVWDLPEKRLWSPTPDPRDCSTVVTGTIDSATSDLLGQAVSCSTATCPFVAKLDAAGSPAWIKVYDFGGDAWTTPVIAGVLADGRIALAGPFQAGAIDLGNGPLMAPPLPGSAVFVAMLSPEGDALWTRHFVKEGTQYFLASAGVSPAGDIAVAVSPEGPVDFGEGPVPAPGASVPGGVALASYDSSGALRFGKVIVAPYGTLAPSLALDSAGRVIVTAWVPGATDFGKGPLGADPNAAVKAVAAFDAAGQVLWSAGLDADPWSVPTVDPSGHVWIGGPGALTELDTTGALLATHPLGGSGNRDVAAIGFTPSGAPVIAGSFDGTLDLGQGALTANSKRDAFVATMVP